MATSDSYEFKNTPIDDFFREAFERIGLIGNEITGIHIQSAIMSANLELTEWQGRTPLQWTRKMFMTNVKPNETTVEVDPTVSKIIDVVFTTPQRLNKAGVAASSSVPISGSAANCFTPTSFGGCSLDGVNSWISYSYPLSGVSYPCIAYVGIEGLNSHSSYQFNIEYSFDNEYWVTAKKTPLKKYLGGQLIWWVVENTANARHWRVRDVSGADRLDLNQIYFCVPSQVGAGDRAMLSISETNYVMLPLKASPNSGYPSSYFYNPQVSPYMKLWPVLAPQAFVNKQSENIGAILYTAYQYVQTIENLFEEFNVPQSFFEALVSGIAKRLALKFAPDRYELLSRIAAEAFPQAAFTDAPTFSIKLVPDFNSIGRT